MLVTTRTRDILAHEEETDITYRYLMSQFYVIVVQLVTKYLT
jgi:hypothetical protein